LAARYAAVHAKKSGLGRSIRLQQQQYTQRRADAEIPENLGYKPKHEIGGDLVEEAVNSDLDFGCVLGDSNSGKSPTLRRRLRKQTIPYALELVPSKFPVVTEETPLQEESESGSSDPDETHW